MTRASITTPQEPTDRFPLLPAKAVNFSRRDDSSQTSFALRPPSLLLRVSFFRSVTANHNNTQESLSKNPSNISLSVSSMFLSGIKPGSLRSLEASQ